MLSSFLLACSKSQQSSFFILSATHCKRSAPTHRQTELVVLLPYSTNAHPSLPLLQVATIDIPLHSQLDPEGQKKYVKERRRLYRLKNKEKINELKRRYRLRNKDKITEQSLLYRLGNVEKIKQYGRLYYLNNKEKFKQHHRLHRDEINRRFREAYLNQKERKKDYRAKNREALRVRSRLYYLAHYEKFQQYRLEHSKPRKTKQWTTPELVRNFFESVKANLHVDNPMDWYRISRMEIHKQGGLRLYAMFGNLGKALHYAFPYMNWDLSKFSFRGKKSRQRWLRITLGKIIPEGTEIFEDFLHRELVWDENAQYKMELDIWVPKYELALEYQGEQHYLDIHGAYGPSVLYKERDLKKKTTCAEKGITLITIPYWWDGSPESLSSTLHLIRPDLFPSTKAPPISTEPPETPHRFMNNQIASFLMHGRGWSVDDDPTGWIISEKLDGFRAYWDGSKLYSKQGGILPVPFEFTSSWPSNVSLDGELWAGYDSLNKLHSIIKQTTTTQNPQKLSELWRHVKFCVFDAPMHPGYYLERHSLASHSISRSDSNVCIVPVEPCFGLKHLQRKLQDITEKKGGEGIMLYHPEATYTSGRTSNLLKVKGQNFDVT